MQQRGHELVLSPPQPPLMVDGDAMRLQQVVVNLLANSAKFTPNGGRIALEIERHGDEAVLTVTDDGIGIEAGVLPNVFGLFIQAKTSNDRSRGGLGLGLTLVRRLVELHGGVVGIESAGLGSGSKVTVRLPALAQTPRVPAAKTDSGATETATSPRRVLVVDDNADMTSSTAMLLEMLGHEVLTAGDGFSAVALAEREVPDAVLLDIGLPGIDGMEVARRLRRTPQTQQALLIAISGYGQDEDRRQAMEAGFDHHLAKPVNFERLAALIAKAGPAND